MTAIIIAILPLILLRGRTLLACWSTLVAFDALAWIVCRQTLGLERNVWLIVLAVLNVAIFSLFVARGENVRWSATRAALVAALVYAIAMPAMLQVPIDGDEPWYLLITESLAHDRDLDLANQYRTLAQSQTQRPDLGPLPGDPIGPHGEQYSRHEPFLPLLLVPGYLIGGLLGALATIALFGALLVRSTLRMFEDEGISDSAARAVFPFLAFAPPILFYSLRIWPEVPAAFFFVEAVRGVTQRRAKRWLPALLGLVLLKLRFVLIAVSLGVRRQSRRFLIIAAIIAIPLLIALAISGRLTNVHSIKELIPIFDRPLWYLRGFFGLLLDGMSGIAFQAPFYLLGIYALTRWKSTPNAFRTGMIASILYLVVLIPRAEWHGGWAPPLRYIVVFMPILALGAAAVWDRVSPAIIAIISAATIGLVIHGLAWPWRLFHIANGENPLGEWLSEKYATDFSRIFPSFIRANDAAIVASVVLIALLLVGRALARPGRAEARPTWIALFALALA
ncbi:MAG TPA: hypothetical protein VMU84_05805, partial [Thermoanaerobaculia bacterium]|nr:hypothetical protein [Thermoanaerobaculia bacterium]